jgi:putative transposase
VLTPVSVNISRGSVYYESEPISDADLKLMRRIDELHLELPFAGARMLRDLLRAEGFAVGRKHMTTLMRRMGISALYRKPNTSKRAPGHTIWPYLLRTLAITRSNPTPFCTEAVEEAIAKYGKPEIFNTDQGGSRVARSSACCSKTASASRWTARAAGATTCSSNGCGQ